MKSKSHKKAAERRFDERVPAALLMLRGGKKEKLFYNRKITGKPGFYSVNRIIIISC